MSIAVIRREAVGSDQVVEPCVQRRGLEAHAERGIDLQVPRIVVPDRLENRVGAVRHRVGLGEGVLVDRAVQVEDAIVRINPRIVVAVQTRKGRRQGIGLALQQARVRIVIDHDVQDLLRARHLHARHVDGVHPQLMHAGGQTLAVDVDPGIIVAELSLRHRAEVAETVTARIVPVARVPAIHAGFVALDLGQAKLEPQQTVARGIRRQTLRHRVQVHQHRLGEGADVGRFAVPGNGERLAVGDRVAVGEDCPLVRPDQLAVADARIPQRVADEVQARRRPVEVSAIVHRHHVQRHVIGQHRSLIQGKVEDRVRSGRPVADVQRADVQSRIEPLVLLVVRRVDVLNRRVGQGPHEALNGAVRVAAIPVDVEVEVTARGLGRCPRQKGVRGIVHDDHFRLESPAAEEHEGRQRPQKEAQRNSSQAPHVGVRPLKYKDIVS